MSGFPLPESVYVKSLIPKDSPVQIQILRLDDSSAAALITQDFIVPGYSDFYLISAACNTTAGAAQTFVKSYLGIQPPTGGNVVWVDQDEIGTVYAAATEYVIPFHNAHGLYIPRNYTLRLQTSYSAGAAANVTRFCINGFFIPPMFI